MVNAALFNGVSLLLWIACLCLVGSSSKGPWHVSLPEGDINQAGSPFMEFATGNDGIVGPLMDNSAHYRDIRRSLRAQREKDRLKESQGTVSAPLKTGGNGLGNNFNIRFKTEKYTINTMIQASAANQAEYDYNLQIQRCRDTGEAYSASYLITREHLTYQFTNYNLTWVNCEMGSFIMMGRQPGAQANGTVLQSIDVLDFSVIHLSAFERLQLRWAVSSPLIKADRHNLTNIVQAAEELKKHTLEMRKRGSHLQHPAFEKTVVVMPYLGVDMGAGHSKLSNRQAYLHACFWSFYEHYTHVVAAVKSPKDVHFIRNMSGLPFYDVMLMENLPKSASLPVSTVQETKRRITSGMWDFDYMFFTESDQILMMRIPELLYSYLNKHPRHLMIPHRLMAYPASVVMGFHKRVTASNAPYDWMDMQCCLTRQHCTDRKEWMHVSNTSVPIVQIYHIQVPLGNSDFHRENYRGCKLRASHEVGYCP